MNVDKKIKKFHKRFDKASEGDTVKVVKFKRHHFKDKLAQTNGFGVHDLKEGAKEFYQWMICEKMDITMVPNVTNTENFSVLVTLQKDTRKHDFHYLTTGD